MPATINVSVPLVDLCKEKIDKIFCSIDQWLNVVYVVQGSQSSSMVQISSGGWRLHSCWQKDGFNRDISSALLVCLIGWFSFHSHWEECVLSFNINRFLCSSLSCLCVYVAMLTCCWEKWPSVGTSASLHGESHLLVVTPLLSKLNNSRTLQVWLKLYDNSKWPVSSSSLLLELKALAELLGPYGVGHLSYRMLQQISSQVQEIKVMRAWESWGFTQKIFLLFVH